MDFAPLLIKGKRENSQHTQTRAAEKLLYFVKINKFTKARNGEKNGSIFEFSYASIRILGKVFFGY
jgi:hypothetical protein